ncbi:cytochrome P450 [Bradyrhizobium sp. BR 1432]|uniref:cytochrome P450 n=1 Tax=Bradyrhizobium sp. BR 1432 TaxID=3447966 RepID=UPI003EE64E00
MSSTFEVNVFSPAFLENPFPIYEQLRTHDPVYWSPELGAWLVSRYADVKTLLSDEHVTADQKAWSGYQRVADAGERYPNVLWALDQTLLLRHGSIHSRLRRFGSEPFASAGCERVARVTQAVVREVLDGFAGRYEIDLLSDYSTPLRIKVMNRLFGSLLTPEQENFLVHGTNAALGFLEPSIDSEILGRNDAALRDFRALVDGLVEQALAQGTEDSIIGDLLNARRGDDRLTQEEVVSLVFSYLLAGTEANGSLITMGILVLLEHRAELAALLKEPERFDDAVVEILRFRSFTKFLPRYVLADFELDGRKMRKGEIVLLLFQSAFRDPDAFENPDVFDIGRCKSNELAFGAGAHRCVGERMAKIEGAIALREFFARFPNANLRDPNADWVKHHMLVAVPRAVPVVPMLLS